MRGGEAGQLLAKELHHVVALRLAVDQQIESKLLLHADDRAAVRLRSSGLDKARRTPIRRHLHPWDKVFASFLESTMLKAKVHNRF